MLPRTIEECCIEIDEMISEHEKNLVLKWTEDEFISEVHHSYGRWIRNNWGLWQDSDLKVYLEKLGLKHADDMSSIILRCYWHEIRNKRYNIETMIKEYNEYWRGKDI